MNNTDNIEGQKELKKFEKDSLFTLSIIALFYAYLRVDFTFIFGEHSSLKILVPFFIILLIGISHVISKGWDVTISFSSCLISIALYHFSDKNFLSQKPHTVLGIISLVLILVFILINVIKLLFRGDFGGDK